MSIRLDPVVFSDSSRLGRGLGCPQSLWRSQCSGTLLGPLYWVTLPIFFWCAGADFFGNAMLLKHLNSSPGRWSETPLFSSSREVTNTMKIPGKKIYEKTCLRDATSRLTLFYILLLKHQKSRKSHSVFKKECDLRNKI